ncbi:hypothetical protein K469DRAFT_716434 [Zopfia rhizophila CBS 207.26]|uniref:Zn(2)-C6 fungal-type domain-containing protein n=1 Tax=Zopfia rhizophila CBS 207.26 TaxID=1314779 RepID=A0A6A6DJZ3_9PEZI|nr:hypothetical protein K469DRAFT_716434 [Zopfia rhizophila CBS 207.26]
MEEVDHPSGEKPSHTRTSQACQRCRNLKTRCLPSEQAGTCQRCFSSKRECVWPETQRRAKRLRGPSRISQVEQKIDGLVASLVNPDVTRPTETAAEQSKPKIAPSAKASSQKPHATDSWLPVPSSFNLENNRVEHDIEGNQRFLENLQRIHNFGDEDDLTRPPGTLFNTSAQREPAIEHDIIKDLLASDEAEVLLNEYRSMADSFPFVPIPLSLTAKQLSISKPMLFLAILTIASWKDHQRQLLLDEKYRIELAHRTIIKPRRTLSLVQSTIVYLSWYQFVFSHKTQQIFSLLQLSIGLALDIGLHQKSRRSFMDMPGRPKPPPASPTGEREAQRTFLGCYYLSSAIAGGLQKPNLLRYTDYMAECGRRLKRDVEYPSDEILLHLIGLRQIDDRINDSFYSEDSHSLPITDSRISMPMQFMQTQLNDWNREKKSNSFQRVLELPYSYTKMQLHSIALRPPLSDNSQLAAASPTQLNALLIALEAGKAFLDSLLAFPTSEYHLITFVEWMRLPYIVVTISKLCIPSELHTAAQWDVQAAQDRVRLDLYLESLCYRMQSLTTYDKVKQPHPDFWMAMKMILDLTKGWYTRRVRASKAPPAIAGDLPTPDTMRDTHDSGYSGPSETPSTVDANEFSFPSMGSMDVGMGHVELESGGRDPFAFMRDLDFDMDQFLDMGIWGSHGSYEGMGFGDGA